MTEHPFAQYIRILGKGKRSSRALTEQEAFDSMQMILQKKVEDSQLGAFMMLLRVKEEEAEELLGFVQAVKAGINAETTPAADIDWPSYAGKKNHHPWYVLSALLLAQNNRRVFMHGSAGHTPGRLYTEDVFNTLGLPVANSWVTANQHLDSNNLCYAPLTIISPELQRIMEFRSLLGLRSPVHSLARLINPCNAEHIFQSVFHPSYQPTHQQAALALGYRNTAVIKGDGGEGERRPDAICLVQKVVNGEPGEEKWPAIFTDRYKKEIQLNTNSLAQEWSGKSSHPYGEKAVIATTAIALKMFDDSKPQQLIMQQAESMWHERNKSLL